ncbi:sialidase family protein [Luteimonas sp. MC1895]|uniref:sialidase family protein n=1 Tax=Luteimonas sp. MC1895 TaxID=2819513 RepID=UPI0018F09AC4|nr:sialidase family protein [Luteimonas sp. MC1895]MBJ6979170.1 exo-alpha-sialidase [Luteimonas sp. MC1895]
MRTAILALAVLGLVAGCGDEAPAPAADVPSSTAIADPALERVVTGWPLPAMLPGSALPDLVAVDGDRLLLSWINSQPGRRHIFQFSSYDLAGARWETAPATIAVGNSMFVNWADTPHIMATADGALWAHWLQKNGDAPAAYDVVLAVSRDGGRRWSEPVRPHADGTRTEHGFVSMWRQPQDGLGIAWLDGRNTAGAHAAGGVGADGAMTLRATSFDAGLRGGAEVEIDASVCDCCQTSAAVTARGPLLVYRGRTAGEVRDILATRLDGDAWTPPKPVHADGWEMAACPVNGPAVAAHGEAAVVGWYTAASGEPEVRVAHSADAGDSFAAPVVLDAGDAVHGRVAVALDPAQAWILWLREDGEGQSLWLSRRSPDLATEYQRLEVARLAGRGRGTGFPQLAVAGGVAHVVWTDAVDGVASLHGARIVPR